MEIDTLEYSRVKATSVSVRLQIYLLGLRTANSRAAYLGRAASDFLHFRTAFSWTLWMKCRLGPLGRLWNWWAGRPTLGRAASG